MTWLQILLCVYGVLCVCQEDEYPPGHQQPLGSHKEPLLVARLSTAPSSVQFHRDYVQPNLPVVFEGLLNATQLLQTWGDDEYLRERFGGEEVNVEHKKKENRSETGFVTTMADYLDRYRSEDIYMVNPLSAAMQEEWMLPSFLLCGGFANNFALSYIWFSSGGTRSVLHTDSFENLHCLVSGVKEVVLIEPRYTDIVGPEHELQGYYDIDVDSVDMVSHPGLVSVPWHRALVWAGDCLYLPHTWLHHVRSHDRNLGVNLWWTDFQYDPGSCVGAELSVFSPLVKYGMTPELQLKQGLLDNVGDDDIIYASTIHQTLLTRQSLPVCDLKLEVVNKMFEIMKPGCQGQLSTSDLHSLPVERIVSAYQFFMSSVQPAPWGEGEWEDEGGEWEDEGGEWGGGGWEDGEWGYSEVVGDEEAELEEGGGDYPHDHQSHDEL